MKTPVVSGKKTIKALYKVGFIIVRQKGSHVEMEKQTKYGVTKVTVPLHSSLKKGVLRIIFKQVELGTEEFLELF